MPKLVTSDPSGSSVLTVDDMQMTQLRHAASLLPQEARNGFLRSVANRINDCCDPTDADIHEAITFVLACRGISYSAKPYRNRVRLFDSANNERRHRYR